MGSASAALRFLSTSSGSAVASWNWPRGWDLRLASRRTSGVRNDAVQRRKGLHDQGSTRMGKEHLKLPLLVGLFWMASRSQGSDTVLLYPTIMMPRNITMGFGTFVNFRCELNITAGSASEVFWLLGGARIPNDLRRHSKLETPAEGRYVSHLEVRDLQAADAGRYTCDATARLNNLNLVRVIPDNVYLSVADYRAAHWGEPCDGLKGAETCVDANTGCFKDRPPDRITATGWSCQCVEGFPIHNPALGRCERGSSLGGPCVEDGQCRWFTQFSVCQRGVCRCSDAYTTSRDGTECTPVIPEGRECSMDWECEPSGMECIERSCRHTVAVSGGQAAVLALLSVVAFCLLVYLAVLLMRRARQKKKLQKAPVYVIPMTR